VERGDSQSIFLKDLGVGSFRQRFPWIGGDLQTLRDTFTSEKIPLDDGEIIKIPVPETPSGLLKAGKLLAFLEQPKNLSQIKGLVLLVHGLGGSSRRLGLRRMALALNRSGFAVLRLNLRGADPGRKFAGGTYSAKCNSDLIPVIGAARKISTQLTQENKGEITHIPLYGVGISLGGTILLNACFEGQELSCLDHPILDGLVCISSPLDLSACSSSIERPRNFIYQNWLLNRLVRQTLADPFGINDKEKDFLIKPNGNRSKNMDSIRAFDSAITAPRWGYKDVDTYYKDASPINSLLKRLGDIPPILFVQSLDDPWVPSEALSYLEKEILMTKYIKNIDFVFTEKGGHNGFHSPKGCWGDYLVSSWLLKRKNIY
tara:strand:- start:2201 stop:3322 length:1122 start_codon:yes stop_codon:yes gene_type:complete